jgi:hypothetical protein
MNGTATTSPAFIASIGLAALRAILQAITVAAAGFYLGRRGVMTKAGAKLVSAVSMRVAIPCLLFSRVLPSVDLKLVAAVWPMLFFPMLNVSVGALLGWVVVKVTRPAADFRAGTVAAVALGNSTGLPIVLLSVIQHSLAYLWTDYNARHDSWEHRRRTRCRSAPTDGDLERRRLRQSPCPSPCLLQTSTRSISETHD